MPGKHELVVSLLTLHVPVFTILCPQRALPDSPCMQLRQSTAPATASLRIAGAGAAGAFPSLVTSSLIQTFETSSTRSRSHRLPPALPSIPLVPVTCPLRIMSAQEFMTSASVLCGSLSRLLRQAGDPSLLMMKLQSRAKQPEAMWVTPCSRACPHACTEFLHYPGANSSATSSHDSTSIVRWKEKKYITMDLHVPGSEYVTPQFTNISRHTSLSRRICSLSSKRAVTAPGTLRPLNFQVFCFQSPCAWSFTTHTIRTDQLRRDLEICRRQCHSSHTSLRAKTHARSAGASGQQQYYPRTALIQRGAHASPHHSEHHSEQGQYKRCRRLGTAHLSQSVPQPSEGSG